MSVLLECTCHCDDRPECIAAEGGKKYTLYNKSKLVIRKVRVDGCFPQDVDEKRCDYLMNVESAKRAIFIELKGGGLTKAIKQLHSTIQYLKNELKGYQVDARIVGNGDVPKARITPEYRNLVAEVKSRQGTLLIRTNSFDEVI